MRRTGNNKKEERVNRVMRSYNKPESELLNKPLSQSPSKLERPSEN